MINNIKNSYFHNVFFQIFFRFICSIVLFSITAFFTPSFQTSDFNLLIVVSIILSIIDYLIFKYDKFNFSILIKCFFSFIIFATALYLIRFLLNIYSISWFTILISSLIYGITNYLISTSK